MSSERLSKIVILVIIAVYILLRLWRLDEACLWFDEIFSVHAAEQPWGELFRFVALDLIHPPLFYVRLKVWMQVVGDGVFWLRLLPVIISCLAIVPFLFLCRELKLKFWTTALALFLLAVNGSLIKYAQEVRMYSLLLCLSLFSMWLFMRYFNRGKGLVWLVIVNVLLVYSHYFGWLVVCSEVAAILWFQRSRWRHITTMVAIVFAAFLPWLIAVMQAARGGSVLGQNIGWMTRPGPRELLVFLLDLIEPFYYQVSSVETPSVWLVSLPILLIIPIAVVLCFATWNQRTADEKRALCFLSIFAGLPVLVAFIASWLLPYSIWGTRHLIIVFAPLAILFATAVTSISVRWLQTAAITLVILFSGYAFILKAGKSSPQYSWCAWGQLADYWTMARHYSSEPKTIYAFEELIGYHLWFAVRDHPSKNVNVVKGFAGTLEDRAFFLPRGFDEVRVVEARAAFSGEEFWIAFRDPDPNHDFPGLAIIEPPRPRVIQELDRLGYEQVDTRKIRVREESAFLVKMLRRSPDGQ